MSKILSPISSAALEGSLRKSMALEDREPKASYVSHGVRPLVIYQKIGFIDRYLGNTQCLKTARLWHQGIKSSAYPWQGLHRKRDVEKQALDLGGEA